LENFAENIEVCFFHHFFKTSQFKISTNSSLLKIKKKLLFLFQQFYFCVRKSLYPVKEIEAFCN